MKKHILKTSLLVLLFSFLTLQHVTLNMFVENAPIHTLEDKIEKEKESKEDLTCLVTNVITLFIYPNTIYPHFEKPLHLFEFKDNLLRPPIV